MRTLKDSKQYRNISKYQIRGDKESRKYWRREIKKLRHKILMHIPITKSEIRGIWWYSRYVFDTSFTWLGDCSYRYENSESFERWVDVIFKRVNKPQWGNW